MNWFAQYVVSPEGAVFWREGMRVTNQALVEAVTRDAFIAITVQTCAHHGVAVGEA